METFFYDFNLCKLNQKKKIILSFILISIVKIIHYTHLKKPVQTLKPIELDYLFSKIRKCMEIVVKLP